MRLFGTTDGGQLVCVDDSFVGGPGALRGYRPLQIDIFEIRLRRRVTILVFHFKISQSPKKVPPVPDVHGEAPPVPTPRESSRRPPPELTLRRAS